MGRCHMAGQVRECSSSTDRHYMSGDVNRENCFLRGTIWACNMIQLYLRVFYYLGINRNPFPIQH
jgi:hypothetical protein